MRKHKQKNNSSIKSMTQLFETIIWILSYFVFYHVFIEEFNLGRHFLSTFIYTLVFLTYLSLSIINKKILLPKFFENRKYKLYGISLFLVLFVAALILNKIVHYSLHITHPHHEDPSVGWMGFFFLFGLTYTGLGAFFYFFTRMQHLRDNLLIYEKEKIDAELTALRAQINPHLLFNTLNNIYSLSLDKSDKTPEMILKLSDLMSYVLYDCKKEKVLVKYELSFIDNYLELEKMRFENNINISYSNSLQEDNIEIAPLLFLPFIENAFKHVGTHTNEKANITISISQPKENCIQFQSSNSFVPDEESDKNPYSGIGIENINKRLTYLYPNRFDLKIDEGNYTYSVNLIIEL